MITGDFPLRDDSASFGGLRKTYTSWSPRRCRLGRVFLSEESLKSVKWRWEEKGTRGCRRTIRWRRHCLLFSTTFTVDPDTHIDSLEQAEQIVLEGTSKWSCKIAITGDTILIPLESVLTILHHNLDNEPPLGSFITYTQTHAWNTRLHENSLLKTFCKRLQGTPFTFLRKNDILLSHRITRAKFRNHWRYGVA